jgi:hypothetical protein
MNPYPECKLVSTNFDAKILEVIDIRVELAAAHQRELSQLADLASTLLSLTQGDIPNAEDFLEDIVDLLFEGGAFQNWRYRILIKAIRKGDSNNVNNGR